MLLWGQKDGCDDPTYHLCHPLDWHILAREQFAFSGMGNKNMATRWQPLMRTKRPNGKNVMYYIYLAGFGLALQDTVYQISLTLPE